MTVLEVLNRAAALFKEQRIRNPRLNAELLVAHTLNLSREGLYTHLQDPVGEREKEEAGQLVQRRLSGEPLQYIIGHQQFWSVDLQVDPRVLIPRPDTEVLVEQALEVLSKIDRGGVSTVLEIGTGSGAIAIVLASEVKGVFVVATDLSYEALRLARSNAERAGVRDRISFVTGDLFCPLRYLEEKEQPFDLIVSNPPYIVRSEIGKLEREVKEFEPAVALDGGEDGLDFHRKIVFGSPQYLRPGGWLVLEVGQSQAGEVCEMMERTDSFDSLERIRDLSGIERVVRGRRKTRLQVTSKQVKACNLQPVVT